MEKSCSNTALFRSSNAKKIPKCYSSFSFLKSYSDFFLSLHFIFSSALSALSRNSTPLLSPETPLLSLLSALPKPLEFFVWFVGNTGSDLDLGVVVGNGLRSRSRRGAWWLTVGSRPGLADLGLGLPRSTWVLPISCGLADLGLGLPRSTWVLPISVWTCRSRPGCHSSRPGCTHLGLGVDLPFSA
uniref:Uncharacterized protein n=1 Tax=Fagus sylvatica TaxID=28930 RepID=A0A2N9EFH1_FAGSY